MTDDAADESKSGGSDPERAIDPVLLNALADATDQVEGVLEDDASRTLLRETLEGATSEADREGFEAAIQRVRSAGETSGEDRETVATVVDAVRAALADRGARVVVDHRATVSIGAREAALYNFSRSKDPAELADLSLPAAAMAHVEEGAALVGEGDYEAAAAAFSRAVDETGAGDGGLSARTLAGWANHWAGDDAAAIDFVEEAMHLHTDAWSPTLVGFSADPEASFATPQQFRDGKYAAMALLRYTVDCPEETSLTPSVGLAATDGEVREWVELTGDDECTPVPRLGAETVLRLELAGAVPAFPAMHGYYLGLGVVDREVTETREVYRLFVDGPFGERVTETVRIEPGE